MREGTEMMNTAIGKRAAALAVLAWGVATGWAGASAGSGTAAAESGLLAEADFYVAADGKDTNPGSVTAPFATLARARDAVREKVAAGLDRNLLVLIQGGVYHLTECLSFGPEDSGTGMYGITYAAQPGEKVVLSGGRQIAGWKKGEGGLWTTEVPGVKAGTWYFRQLYVNNRRAVRARTPNLDDQTLPVQNRFRTGARALALALYVNPVTKNSVSS
jgi:hypothetical protein